MVAVGDQELAALERRTVHRDPPQARAIDLDVRGALRYLGLVEALVKEEDWLGLDVRRPEQIHSFLADVTVRPLVRKDAAGLVRLGRDRRDDSPPLPRHAVGTDEVLDEQPGRGVLLPLEDPGREPLGVEPACLVDRVGERQVRDVVRAPPEEALALRIAHDVVRRRHEIGERAGRAGVADGAERLHIGHRGERTNAGRAPWSADRASARADARSRQSLKPAASRPGRADHRGARLDSGPWPRSPSSPRTGPSRACTR